MTELALYGRSSSHFTRVARIFAAEFGVDYAFRIVPDLMSSDPADYGGNPALRLPTLVTPSGVWFGALNISRELWRQSRSKPKVVWAEHFEDALTANVQEFVLQAMASEVALIMAKASGAAEQNPHQAKVKASLVNLLDWLEQNAQSAVARLPADRQLSALEVTLYCLVTHLEFRKVLPTTAYSNLNEFARHFGRRTSADQTAYAFDR